MNKYITELIGTFFWAMAAILGGTAGGALALMVMVYAGGHVSGAHYNPAVTLSVWMRGKIEMKDAVMYWIFQFAGAIIAALLVMYFFSNEGSGECKATEGWGTRAIVAEMLGTFALAYVILNVITAKGTSGNSYYGLAIGGTVWAMATALGGFSGGVFSPALAIGFCVQQGFCWDHVWVYFVGPLGGGALAAIVFSFINPDDK